MRFTFAIFLGSVLSAFALPAPAPILKRGPLEVVYLTTCCSTVVNNCNKLMNYYADTNASQNGQLPDSTAGLGAGSNWFGTSHGYFPDSGVVFTSNINSTTTTVGALAGSGDNGYQPGFKCYRDNGRVLYADTATAVCRAQYYCMH